ncbi:MAG: putative 7-carboxy-7-deazaguanine synthase QueE [Anaeroplasmataceae bacterium]|nr:putative 7-carboxy-7-deazaguanine synthase QueE [Anaeroplasmataceae bacterium]
MRVVEKFISINGEGIRQGQLAVFIRFANCNLRCVYCDTIYSYDHPKYTEESINEIVDYILFTGIKNVTLTGGEPLIQPEIKELLESLSRHDLYIEIETNGSISILPYRNIKNVSFTLDYKTPYSMEETKMEVDNYKYITNGDTVKFVCGDKADLIRSKEIMDQFDLYQKTNCIISPVFGVIDPQDIVDFMKEYALNSVRIQLQIHKLIWDKEKRGV